MPISRLSRLLGFLLIASLSVSGCKSKDKNSAAKHEAKRSITIGIAQEPDSLFMPFKEMMASEEVARVGNYSLTIFDENWKLIPWAAKEIPTQQNGKLEIFKDHGKTKMRTTWEIRDEFKWSDGKPLTADDFVFAHQIYNDPSQEVVDRTVAEKVEKIEAKGDNRKILVVTWKEPYAYYHNYRQHAALPKHMLEAAYRRSPKKFKEHPFGQSPSLAGSFTIKEWVPGTHIVAERNPHAKGFIHSQFDEVIWRIIPQTNTLESNLVSGTIDAISPTGLALDQALQFQKRYGKDFDFHFTPGLVWEHIDFNLDNEILKDRRVRHALAFGANRAGIVKLLFAGRQPVAHGTEPPKSPYYHTGIKKYHFNPAKAEALLDAAGWRRKSKEEIRSKNGEPLKLVLMTTSGNKTRERVEQLLQSQWRQIGIDIQIKNQPAKVFFGQTMRRRKYSAMAMYSWIKDPLTVSDTLWRCDYIPTKENSYMGQNQPGWCNKKADALLKQASRELDDKKRAKIGQAFEEIWAEELPALPLYFRVEVSVTKKGLKNWKPTGMLQPITWNAHEWAWN